MRDELDFFCCVHFFFAFACWLTSLFLFFYFSGLCISDAYNRYVFHVEAAKIAIKHKVQFCTASYVSKAMEELDEQAKAAGVILLNECGVDPVNIYIYIYMYRYTMYIYIY